jgi:hypothetical protein
MPAYRARPQVGLLSRRRDLNQGGSNAERPDSGRCGPQWLRSAPYGVAVRGAMCAHQVRLTTVNTETPIRYYLNQMLKRAGTGDLSPSFPPLKSRVRGCRHAHRDGVSLFG